jgi:hypothetical protein
MRLFVQLGEYLARLPMERNHVSPAYQGGIKTHLAKLLVRFVQKESIRSQAIFVAEYA